MVVTNLFPGGLLQLVDVLQNGYWHARSPEFLHERVVRTIEWLRLPGDIVFIGLGVVPAVIAAAVTCWRACRNPQFNDSRISSSVNGA